MGSGVSSFHLHGFAVGFAAGFVTGGKPRDFKPRVLLEQLDEALTNDSGGAKNADLVSCFCIGLENILVNFRLFLALAAADGICPVNAERYGLNDFG